MSRSPLRALTLPDRVSSDIEICEEMSRSPLRALTHVFQFRNIHFFKSEEMSRSPLRALTHNNVLLVIILI